MMNTVVTIHEIDVCLAKIILNHTVITYVHKTMNGWVSDNGFQCGKDLKEVRQSFQDKVLYNEYRGLPLTCGLR